MEPSGCLYQSSEYAKTNCSLIFSLTSPNSESKLQPPRRLRQVYLNYVPENSNRNYDLRNNSKISSQVIDPPRINYLSNCVLSEYSVPRPQ